ncbi:MAG: antitoxin [Deltaproteobacteria bacterium]|nr:antitoxin [Deltaproteobacteria bacterium]
MSRLSIELTPEQHQQLKAIAALQGQTLKDYILERTLPHFPRAGSLSEEETVRRLETFLEPRITEAERGAFVEESVEQIFASVRRDDR